MWVWCMMNEFSIVEFCVRDWHNNRFQFNILWQVYFLNNHWDGQSLESLYYFFMIGWSRGCIVVRKKKKNVFVEGKFVMLKTFYLYEWIVHPHVSFLPEIIFFILDIVGMISIWKLFSSKYPVLMKFYSLYFSHLHRIQLFELHQIFISLLRKIKRIFYFVVSYFQQLVAH